MNLRWLLPFVLALGLVGCASTSEPVEVNDQRVSLVFGYFDMKDAPSGLDWVSLKKYDSKKKDGEWYRMGVQDGLYFHVGVEPGAYQVDKFGGMGGVPLLTRRPFEYNFGGKGRNGTALRITQPGVYFLGAHKYVNHAGKGLFEADKFAMEPVQSPTEKELLQRLVKALESDQELAGYTRQLSLAKQRLSQL
ncbi:MAG: hypothetical protein KJ025_04395 [Burkholderiales bacterium]|nr:hypothetical protein [Burkholderiales bacterium]